MAIKSDETPADNAPVIISEKSVTSEPKYKGRELLKTMTGITRDVLSTLIDPTMEYTEAEVKQKLSDFMKKEAK